MKYGFFVMAEFALWGAWLPFFILTILGLSASLITMGIVRRIELVRQKQIASFDAMMK